MYKKQKQIKNNLLNIIDWKKKRKKSFILSIKSVYLNWWHEALISCLVEVLTLHKRDSRRLGQLVFLNNTSAINQCNVSLTVILMHRQYALDRWTICLLSVVINKIQFLHPSVETSNLIYIKDISRILSWLIILVVFSYTLKLKYKKFLWTCNKIEK